MIEHWRNVDKHREGVPIIMGAIAVITILFLFIYFFILE